MTRADLDLSVSDAIPRMLNTLNPDLIINPAAYTAVDRAEDEPELAYRINAEAPGLIADWAAEHGVPLVHLSTDYVFEGSGGRPWDEGDTPHPLSVYGASKLAGEEAIRAARGQHLIVRTSWVYAAKGQNFLLTIARLAGERDELRVVADQFGAPTPAVLIADAIAKIVAPSRLEIGARFAAAQGLVHLSATGETSWYGFARAIIDGLRARGLDPKAKTVVPIRTPDYPTKARRPFNSRLQLTRFHRVFGWIRRLGRRHSLLNSMLSRPRTASWRLSDRPCKSNTEVKVPWI